jgi:hypothetical protein
MILKLIKTNDTPKIGDLGKDWISKDLYVIKSEEDLYYAQSDTILKPYGVSDEDIKEGDTYICWETIGDVASNYTIIHGTLEASLERYNLADNYKKVVILPEQFNYQDIVDLGLKDGDEFEYKWADHISDAVTISKPYVDDRYNRISKPSRSKPTPEKDIDMLLNEFGNELMNKLAWNEIEKSSNGIAQLVTEFLNKKK